MSNAMASASSDERRRRAFDLSDKIGLKLAQAKGICEVVRVSKDIDCISSAVPDALLAASDLIEEVQKAFKELRGIHKEEPPRAVQS